MNPVWASALAVFGWAAAAGLVAWPVAGPAWALAVAALVIAGWSIYHAAHLAALLAWLRGPEGAPLPIGRGLWEDVLAELHRHLKRREEERAGLEKALARFRAAGRALPDGVLILDAAGRIEWSNPTAELHFGVEARRDFGQAITHFVRHPQFVAYFEAGDYREPIVLRGARQDAVLSVRVIEFGEDQKLVNSRDITAQERLENMRRDFVANVSHEMKTPITVLSGFIDTLSDDALGLSEAQRRRFLGLMGEQAKRMQRLIEDLLTLSALESTPAPAEEQAIEVGPLLDGLAEEARALSAGRHRVAVSVEPECRLTGNQKELHSAFSNLVSNAIRYTPEGGAVRLAWRLESGRGVFSVEDDGIGIESRHLPRLTERFYRVDQGRSRESGGTGLGLAIVKHVLARHQASLEIRSEFGRGSTFRAVFPPQRVAPRPAQRAA